MTESYKNRLISRLGREDGPSIQYQVVLDKLREFGFEPSPSEAVYLRGLVAEVIAVDAETSPAPTSIDKLNIGKEVIARFLWNYYGINESDYLQTLGPDEDEQAAMKKLFRIIKDKYRPEQEIM